MSVIVSVPCRHRTKVKAGVMFLVAGSAVERVVIDQRTRKKLNSDTWFQAVDREVE
jgi:hypothetical protein